MSDVNIYQSSKRSRHMAITIHKPYTNVIRQ